MTEESTEAQMMLEIVETTEEIIDMIVDRYGESDDHSPMRMTTATFLALKRMLNALGNPILTLAFAMELQAQGLDELQNEECNDCEEEAATND